METFTEFRIFYGDYCFCTEAENIDKALQNMQKDLELSELPHINSIKKSTNYEAWQEVPIKRQLIK